jgi:hypothetical protein
MIQKGAGIGAVLRADASNDTGFADVRRHGNLP